jgi:hypothetical protein
MAHVYLLLAQTTYSFLARRIYTIIAADPINPTCPKKFDPTVRRVKCGPKLSPESRKNPTQPKIQQKSEPDPIV